MTDARQEINDDNSAAITESPKPRRCWRWLKRIVIGLVVIATVLVAAYWGYYFHVNRLLQTELDAIAARGEPVTLADLAKPPIPDDQNAAVLYRKAVQTEFFVSDDPEIKYLRDVFNGMVFDMGLDPVESEDIEAVLLESSEALELVRQAKGLGGFDWGPEWAITPSEINLEPMGNMNRLARLLLLAARQAQKNGDAAAACDYLHDSLVLGQAVSSEPYTITYLYGNGIFYKLFEAVEDISYELDLSDPTAKKAARQLISALMDESLHLEHFTNAAIGERCFNIGSYELVRQGRYPWELQSKGLSLFVAERLPDAIVTSDQLSMLESMGALVKATMEATYPAAMRKIPPELQRKSIFGVFWNLCDFSYDLFNAFIGGHYERLASRRMAATALAIRLYELDHIRRPETLEKLVPDYLQVVPQDPFFDGARHIGYSPDAELPVLYSVGYNGIDDGGLDQEVEGLTVETGLLDMKLGETADILFYLTTQPEVEEGTTQPAAEAGAE